MPTEVEIFGKRYAAIAASQSGWTLTAAGGSGSAGDLLHKILVIPATTSPGAISIADGGGNAITVFTGGAGSVSNLVPFEIHFNGIRSLNGPWKMTTGANVSVLASGHFT